MTFTPEVDERTGVSKDVTYRYVLYADVTDEGGETRSASKGFRLGFVSVEARIDSDAAFMLADTAGKATIMRTDLNGAPRPGKGTWRLVSLVQPAKALLPSQQPVPKAKEGAKGGQEEFQTPGDRETPRWAASYRPEQVLRAWEAGAEKAKGICDHGAKGEAEIQIPALSAGPYRLLYETTDDFGATCRAQKDFVVAAPKVDLALPAVLMAESTSVPVGGTARFLVHSGLADQILFLDIYRGGQRVERRPLISGKSPSLLEFPVTEKDRGGFGVTLVVLNGYQLMQFSQGVFVPWDNKDLKVEFATFRDKVRPGAKETWRVTVKTPDGKPAEAGAAELLAYMYDRSLDLFAPHNPPSIASLYPNRSGAATSRVNLGAASQCYNEDHDFAPIPGYPSLRDDELIFFSGYGIGGPGRRGVWRRGRWRHGRKGHAHGGASAFPRPRQDGQHGRQVGGGPRAGEGQEGRRRDCCRHRRPLPRNSAPTSRRRPSGSHTYSRAPTGLRSSSSPSPIRSLPGTSGSTPSRRTSRARLSTRRRAALRTSWSGPTCPGS